MNGSDILRADRARQRGAKTEIGVGLSYSTTHGPAITEILARHGYREPDLSALGPETFSRVDVTTNCIVDDPPPRYR